jgi:hypothetical protein
MCGCSTGCAACSAAELRFKEQYFGYQRGNYGQLHWIDAAGQYYPVYYPTNIYPVDFNYGFSGYRYGMQGFLVAPEFNVPMYQGVFPLAEQPKTDVPEPYSQPLYV